MKSIRMTIRRLMVVIAVLAAIFAMICWCTGNLGTRYAAGFTEDRFSRLRIGMTPAQVEEIMGVPLEKIPWPTQGGIQNWVYSDSPVGWNHEQRWVIFKNKSVMQIVKHYWIE